MEELKQTEYKHMKAAIIGSRDQLCIHSDLQGESNANKIQLCKSKVKNNKCQFYNRVHSQKNNNDYQQANVLDIEELVRIGKKLNCCPYYTSKEFSKNAEIIFMPYNYLFNAKLQKANKIDLQNAIIIIDEAHNVTKMCEESCSAVFNSIQISSAAKDVTYVSL